MNGRHNLKQGGDMSNLSKRLFFWTPRVLSIAFIAFLSVFALDVFDGRHGIRQTMLAFLIHQIPVFVLIAVLILSWRREWMENYMRSSILCLFYLALMTPFAAQAQDRGEISVFGGFSGFSDLFDTMYGWNASIAGNMTKHLALAGDFSGYYNGDSSGWFGNEASHYYSFLFGPRYIHNIGKRWTLFAQVLLGPYRETLNSDGYSGSNSRNMMALAFGGGLDIRVTNRFSVRALQFDLVEANKNDSWRCQGGRVSVGAVFRLNRVPQ
jgi:hypothetical protein